MGENSRNESETKDDDFDLSFEKRINTYYELNTNLNYLSDDKVLNKIKKQNFIKGCRNNFSIIVDDHKVNLSFFPIPKKIFQNMNFSKNIYELPFIAHYIDEPEINIYRCLLLNIKLTNFVLSSEKINFQMLYHWRIINLKDIDKLLKINNDKCLTRYGETKWNYLDNKNIDEYLNDRQNAKHYMLFFNEHFDNHLGDKLHLKNFIKYDYKCENILKFLESKNIIYFDIDLFNFKVDKFGEIYLSNFISIIDKQFELNNNEIAYLETHKFFRSIYDKIFKVNSVIRTKYIRDYNFGEKRAERKKKIKKRKRLIALFIFIVICTSAYYFFYKKDKFNEGIDNLLKIMDYKDTFDIRKNLKNLKNLDYKDLSKFNKIIKKIN